MKYMGSKNRIAKEILPIILKDRKPEQWYVEPFCGGLGTFDKAAEPRIANDNNKYLIAMWLGLKEDKPRPKEIPKELYSKARAEFNNKTNIEFDDFMIGWIGFMGSANGRFFDGGYSGKSNTKIGNVRDYIKEAVLNIEKQVGLIQNAEFCSFEYDELDYPENSIIYCDIPYKGTKQYASSKVFNYLKFWQWCREMTVKGHTLFISEYEAPNDFKCVWSKELKSSLSANSIYGGSKSSTEKLFIYEAQDYL